MRGQQECGSVWLTVSSLWHAAADDVRGVTERELEFNWDPSCPPEWVLLFDHEPPAQIGDPNDEAVHSVPSPAGRAIDKAGGVAALRAGRGAAGVLARAWPGEHPDGFARTNVSAGRPALPGGWERGGRPTPAPGDHCLGFWAGAYRAGRRLHADCLKIRPTWMWDHRPGKFVILCGVPLYKAKARVGRAVSRGRPRVRRQQLGQLPLASLFLPGTHNSGCYHKSGGLTRRDTFARYLLTQDTDVWGQLVHGIRYLDLRVGYYPARGKGPPGQHHASRFSVNHDLLRVGPLLPVLHDLKRFLNASRGEVVVLDLHRFPVGFHTRQGRHRKLVSLLVRELGPFIIPSTAATPTSTLAQIWSRERRLIITVKVSILEKCDTKILPVDKESKWLWGPINQMWGNQQTPGGLKNFLQRTMDTARPRSDEPQLWAAMAELTPTPLEVMFKPSGSLRQMADSINRNVTTWFKTMWWQKANIVATDFFLGNDLINVAVAANLRKMNLVEAR
ncbi:Uncharacterized protein GBIM_03026 [Gryllus bimaculatus]|nr:Uncharacterized protein GBIM_03026 [Gryllus bimaculatus]